MKIINKDNRTEACNIKIKTICEHCGKKQLAKEINYCLNSVTCKYCKKQGTLTLTI